MSRAVPEWIGRDDDEAVPGRVRLRVYEAKHHRCHACTREIRAGETWTCEHIVALINGGANRETNLGLTCANCLPAKNAADVAEKSAVARTKKAHLGIKGKSPYRWPSRKLPKRADRVRALQRMERRQ